jgi:hypothetical protein
MESTDGEGEKNSWAGRERLPGARCVRYTENSALAALAQAINGTIFTTTPQQRSFNISEDYL